MDTKYMKIFIDSVTRYFNHIAEEIADVGTPYLIENNNIFNFDFTSVIRVSGEYKGCVYFTAPSVLLNHLLIKLGENDTSSENMIDLVGEVANTISGNARSALGSNFIISVPRVLQGNVSRDKPFEQNRSFVIPINWRSYSAAIVISLSSDDIKSAA